MEIVIITGMSGAGKTAAVGIAQDYDYTTIDNLPPKLIKDYINLLSDKETEKIAFVIDIRVGEFLDDLETEIEILKEEGHDIKVIFMDASDEELIRRFQEKRRPHHYKNLTLEAAIKTERDNLINTREISRYYIDTTNTNLIQLKERLLRIFQIKNDVKINIVSFGYKYGLLKEADFIFDARFIDNPYYINDLKDKTGKDFEVQKYVMNYEKSKGFLIKVSKFIQYIAPSFAKQGKNQLIIGIGCTGGKHRSVTLAIKLNEILSKDFDSKVTHREEQNWKY